ncbi:MAG: nitroreductase family protein [Dehalococcoidia bacterium]|nr:nitroreductase family protein [Dehalococcoidia bacterium]
MDIDNFLDLMHTRRSIRRFKPDAVPEETLQKILEAGRWAMSGANGQPWEFVVVRDSETRQKIGEAWFEPHKEMYAIEQSRLPEIQLPPLREFAATPAWKDAPALIVIVGDRRTYQATVLGASYLVTEGASDAIFLKNMANATNLLNLAAAAAGLGAMWISISRLWAEEIKRILDIPAVLEVHTIVAIGQPAYAGKTATRRPLAEIVHYDGYDASRLRSAADIQKFLLELRQNTEAPYRQGYMPEKEQV